VRTAVVVAGLLVVALVVGAVAVVRLQGNITEVDVTDIAGTNRPTSTVTSDPGAGLPPMNILVMGSDTREGLSNADAFGGVNDETRGQRADTTLVVHLSAGRTSATVVSIPRDLMLPLPDCTDPASTIVGARLRQFNSAFSDGGPGCTLKAVEQNTGIPIDHFAVVNMEGFQSMVDALGGVDMCFSTPLEDRATGLSLPAGQVKLDGPTALQFVRARKGLGNGTDTDRIQRQQDFLAAVVREATSSGLLLRPDRLLRFLDAATRSLQTDPELASIPVLSDMALQVRDVPPDEIRFLTIPVEEYSRDANRLQLAPAAAQVWQALRDDTPLPGTEPAPTPSASPVVPTVPPAAVSVQVTNSSGAEGLALQAASALEAQGFAIAARDNGPAPVVGVVVRHAPQDAEAAVTVQAAFPGATLQADPARPGGVVQVELGAGAPAVVAVPNRAGTGELPPQPIVAPAPPPPPIDVQPASEDPCAA
jgi:LCP family protein required for cell wall assembly